MRTLHTIGYELATQAEVIDRLKTAGVDTVADVRAIASSRRAGFSKSLLAASLAEAGIGYVHLRALGTPKPGRDAAHHGRIAEMTAIYNAHLAEPGAQLELAKAIDLARDHTVALLCFEADHARCHRKIVADLIQAELGCPVEPL